MSEAIPEFLVVDGVRHEREEIILGFVIAATTELADKGLMEVPVRATDKLKELVAGVRLAGFEPTPDQVREGFAFLVRQYGVTQ